MRGDTKTRWLGHFQVRCRRSGQGKEDVEARAQNIDGLKRELRSGGGGRRAPQLDLDPVTCERPKGSRQGFLNTNEAKRKKPERTCGEAKEYELMSEETCPKAGYRYRTEEGCRGTVAHTKTLLVAA